MHHMFVIKPLFRIINYQIMEVEAMNLAGCNLAQKLICLEDIERIGLLGPGLNTSIV